MFRFTRRRIAVVSLLLAMHFSRAAMATEIASPARVNSASAPNIVLNQTGGTYIPYQWLLAGDDANFYVQDSTGLTAPFKIDAGSAEDLLHLAGNNVGIGTYNPAAGLHLRKQAQLSTAEVMARFETTDDPIGGLFIANNSAGDGTFIPKITGRSASQNAALIHEAIITNDLGASPAIVYNAAKGSGGPLVTRPLVVYRNNSVAKVIIAANGDVTATSFNPSSSREIKQDIVDLDAASATEALKTLTPVKYVYKDDESKEPRLGFIAEDVPELVANADRKSVPIMDVVALLTKVVKDQQQTIDEQKRSIEETNRQQQKTIDVLMKRLEALESQASATK